MLITGLMGWRGSAPFSLPLLGDGTSGAIARTLGLRKLPVGSAGIAFRGVWGKWALWEDSEALSPFKGPGVGKAYGAPCIPKTRLRGLRVWKA